MSKLQDLINSLCPNGVEFKPLGEVCDFKRGDTLSSKDAIDGDVPVMAGGQKPSCYHNVANRKGETIVVAGSGAYAGFVTYWNIPVFVSDAFSVNPSNCLLPKYVFYFLKNNQEQIHATKKGAGVPHVHGKDIAKFLIPIPPLAIQEEIVRILDRFADYAAELQAELQARKAQYEYYRNLLLSFDSTASGCGTDDEQKDCVTNWGGHSYTIQWKKMGEIGTVKMCKRIMKNQTSASGDVPFYKIGTFGKEADAYISRELYEDYKQRFSFPSKGTILISAAGTIGRCVIYDGEDAYFQDSNIVWLENDEKQVLNSYLYHFYQIVDWNTDGGTIKRLYNDNFLATLIPVPPLELQEKIVAILDRFETLVNDLSKGLPAEIEAEMARYEYYRNKLLTFEEISA